MAEKNYKHYSSLNYGVFGDVYYDSSSKSWVSQRTITNVSAHGRIQVLDRTPSVLVDSNDSYDGQDSLDLEGREKQIRGLIQQRHEFGSAYAPLLEDLHGGKADGRSLDLLREELNNGDLITFGETHYPVKGYDNMIMVAYPCSASGEEVAISEIRPRFRAWVKAFTRRTANYLISSEFGRGVTETTYWPGDSGKVQQLLFSVPPEEPKRSVLAIRSNVGLTILHFMRRFSHVRSPYAKGSSYLEIQMATSLKIPGAEHQKFTDVCFSPWDQAYVAAITTQGKWCVWKVSLHHYTMVCHVTTPVAGDVPLSSSSMTENGPDKRSRLNNGWYKINFLASPNILVVCTHFEIFVIDTLGRSLVYDPPHIGLVDTPYEILDVRASPIAYNDILLVTSVHIFWLRLNHIEADSGIFQASFEILLSWQHHRDVMDKSLRLSVRDMSSSLYAVLHSVYTNIVTEYRFGDDAGPTKLPISLANPSIVDLPVDTFTDNIPFHHKRQILTLCFHPVKYSPFVDEFSNGVDKSLTVQYYQRGVVFFQIIIQLRDQSIESVLCCIEPISRNFKEGIPRMQPKVQTPIHHRSTKVPKPSVKPRQRLIATDSDASGIDVAVAISDSSEDEEDDENGLKRFHKTLPWKQTFMDVVPEWNSNREYGESLVYSNRIVYQELCKSSIGQAISFTQWAPSIPKQLLYQNQSRGEDDGLTLRTLASLQDPETLQIGNNEESSLTISQLLKVREDVSNEGIQNEDLSRLEVEILPMPNLNHLPRYTDADSLIKLYQRFISCFVTTLPKNISNRARLAREKLVREFTLTICLSSIGARVLSTEEIQMREENDMTQSASQLQLPPPVSQMFSSRSIDSPMSQATNRSMHSRMTSTNATPASSQATTVPLASNQSNSAASALQRLRAYAAIDTPVELRDAPRNEALDRILAHWTVGSDPASYNYNETVARLSGASVIEGSAMSAEQQREIRERAERQRLRQERRAAKRARFEASQPSISGEGVPLVTASQPIGNPSTAASTLAGRTSTNLISASQPQPFERGRINDVVYQSSSRDGRNTAADTRSSQPVQSQTVPQDDLIESSQVSVDTGFAQGEEPRRTTLSSSHSITDPQSQMERGRSSRRRQAGLAPGKKRKSGF